MFVVTLSNSYAAESDFVLDYDLSPQIIHEGDQITLEIYQTMKDQIVLEKIENIRIESLDTSIIDRIASSSQRYMFENI